MLFRKKVEKLCAYCIHAGRIDDGHMICAKRGFVPCRFHCRRFRYDPLKRVPVKARPKDIARLDELDFSL